MKKALILLLASVISVSAQNRGLGLEAGYATVDMSDVNNLFNDYADLVDATSVDEFGSAFYFGATFDFPVAPSFCLGPRVEFINILPAEINADGAEAVGSGYLIPLMAGGRYFFPLNNPAWSVSAGAYLGVALARADREVDVTGLGNWDVPVAGSGFICDVGLSSVYGLSGRAGLLLSLGYRFCTIDDMEVTEDVDEEDIEKGDRAEDWDGDPLDFQFSGLRVGVGIKFGM